MNLISKSKYKKVGNLKKNKKVEKLNLLYKN